MEKSLARLSVKVGLGVFVALWLMTAAIAGPTADSAATQCRYWVYLPLVMKAAGGSGGFPSGRTAYADFNGDGYADLAVGVPLEDVGSVPDAGGVNVLYGTAGGLSATGDQFWSQDSSYVYDLAEQQDLFGWALAAGDFNGDDYGDLAVGIPYEDVGSVVDAGAVNVLYGTAGGLSTTGNEYWHQDSFFVDGDAEDSDSFGWSLAAGDFNGDSYADLAVGVPSEDVESLVDAGAVNVLYGTSDGLSATGDQYWLQNSPDVEGDAGLYDRFGYALAAGNFNGDGCADLAVGVPFESFLEGVSKYEAGAVNLLYGSSDGLSATGDQFWSQDSSDVEDDADNSDNFGRALAAGDFNGDGYADLAVGVPYEDVGSVLNAGAVNVLYGTAGGLSAAGDQYWHQDSTDIEDIAEDSDYFGYGLAAGDFNGDGYGDLAVGVPYEDPGGVLNAGAANVLYGTVGGLSAAGDQLWHQDSTEVESSAEEYDRFGWALIAGDFDGDSYADLAVGVPFESVLSGLVLYTDAGAVNLLYGSSGGLSATGDQFWHQGSPEVEDVVEDFDYFGQAIEAMSP